MVFMNKSTFCIRWTAFVLNAIIWVGGVVMLGFSIWVYSQETEFNHIANDKLAFVCYMSISVLLFVIGLCGTCAILLLKQSLLKVYFALILFMFIAELSVSLYLYLEQDKLQGFVQKNWNASDDVTRRLIQEKFECCSMDPVITSHNSTHDKSCYQFHTNNTSIMRRDCYRELLNWLKGNKVSLLVAAVFVAIIQMFLLGSSCRLLATIESGDRMIRQIKVQPGTSNELSGRSSDIFTPSATSPAYIIERKEWAKMNPERGFKKSFGGKKGTSKR